MEDIWEINPTFLAQCREAWAGDTQGHRVADTLATGTLHDVAMRHSIAAGLPFEFSLELETDGITDQGQSERCWAFSFLNAARRHVVQALDLGQRDFQLSQGYIYFYDQLEKSRAFLQRIIQHIQKPLTHPANQAALRQPITDYGHISFLMLAPKYGAVPKGVMPDTRCLQETRPVTTVLSMKLRHCAHALRTRYAATGSLSALQKDMEAMLRDIYGMLCRFLGEPPSVFTFEYRDSSGTFRRLENQTPQGFFNTYCGIDANDYVEVGHLPSPETPFNVRYYRADGPPGPMPGGIRARLNLSIEDIKAAAIAQLRDGEMVVMGSDVAKMSSKARGYMDAGLFDYEGLFNTALVLEKPESFDYLWTVGTHIMCLSGVNLLPDGRPNRWKVQNSYGDAMGIKGHYVMADNWFDRYVVSAVLHKKHLPPHARQCLDTEPQPLP